MKPARVTSTVMWQVQDLPVSFFKAEAGPDDRQWQWPRIRVSARWPMERHIPRHDRLRRSGWMNWFKNLPRRPGRLIYHPRHSHLHIMTLTTTTASTPIVMFGPSGTGKSTLLKRLQATPEWSNFGFSVSRKLSLFPSIQQTNKIKNSSKILTWLIYAPFSITCLAFYFADKLIFG